MDSQTQTVASVQTPTATSSGNIEYASFGRRLIAFFLDVLIGFAIGFIIGFILGFLGAIIGVKTSMLITILSVLVGVGYSVYFIGSRGQTPGKMILKIKVVRLDNQPQIGYTKAFLREILGKFLSGSILWLGYLWMLWDGKKQTWHDKIAGTIVVKV